MAQEGTRTGPTAHLATTAPKAQRPALGISASAIKSDSSMGRYAQFRQDPPAPGISAASVTSDSSMGRYAQFKQDPLEREGSNVQEQTQLESTLQHLEENISTFVQVELKQLRRLLSTDYPGNLEPMEN
ncbi:unnamed protein product [Knipowitschia caucasica]